MIYVYVHDANGSKRIRGRPRRNKGITVVITIVIISSTESPVEMYFLFTSMQGKLLFSNTLRRY